MRLVGKGPKEKTIVLFVTDGDDTCGAHGSDDSTRGQRTTTARRAAYWAERLYEPHQRRRARLVGADLRDRLRRGLRAPAEPYRLNWIAWGGSGLGQGNARPARHHRRRGPLDRGDERPSPTKRAPVHDLRGRLHRPRRRHARRPAPGHHRPGRVGRRVQRPAVDHGVDLRVRRPRRHLRPPATRRPATGDRPHPDHLQLHAARLPGAGEGVPERRVRQRRAEVERGRHAPASWCRPAWQAACPASATTGRRPGRVHVCAAPRRSDRRDDRHLRRRHQAARLHHDPERRLHVRPPRPWRPTARGVAARQRSGRLLWPPNSTVAPTNYTTEGTLDEALGLPLDSSADPAGDFTTLQNEFGACVGNNRPSGCTSGTASIQMKAARREARDMILAFMAGAQPSIDGHRPEAGHRRGLREDPLRRPLVGARRLGARDRRGRDPAPAVRAAWRRPGRMSTSCSATVTAPSRPDSDQAVRQGYGLRNPDQDQSGTGNDSRNNLKPVMTVVYAPANDMLHAFRAGPNVSPSTACNPVTNECGGQELWGFVPFDQLGALRLRFINEPQGRDNHVYMLARGVRFADVFVAADPPITVNINGQSRTVNGVWRRILYVLRGIGGKYVTALDVTGPGAYTSDRAHHGGARPPVEPRQPRQPGRPRRGRHRQRHGPQRPDGVRRDGGDLVHAHHRLPGQDHDDQHALQHDATTDRGGLRALHGLRLRGAGRGLDLLHPRRPLRGRHRRRRRRGRGDRARHQSSHPDLPQRPGGERRRVQPRGLQPPPDRPPGGIGPDAHLHR